MKTITIILLVLISISIDFIIIIGIKPIWLLIPALTTFPIVYLIVLYSWENKEVVRKGYDITISKKTEVQLYPQQYDWVKSELKFWDKCLRYETWKDDMFYYIALPDKLTGKIISSQKPYDLYNAAWPYIKEELKYFHSFGITKPDFNIEQSTILKTIDKITG